MVNVENLKAELHKYEDEAQQLIDRSKRGQLTDQEERRVNEMKPLIENLQRKIDYEEKNQADESKRAKAPGQQASPGEIRFLNHGDSFSDAMPGSLPDGIRADEIDSGRMIRGLVTGKWKGAEAEQRALMGQEDPAGGYWLPGGLAGSYIDLARANMVTSSAGAITIPVEADSLKVPRVMTDPTVVWRGELETITEGDPSFGSVTLQPKVCSCLIEISEELYQDGKGVGDAVQQVMTRAIGNELDRVILMGGDSGNASEPVGVYHTAGINTTEMGVNGDDLADYDPFLTAIESIEGNNGTASAVIYSPRTKADLAFLVTGVLNDLTKLTPPEDYKNLRKYTTTSIPNDLAWGASGDVCSAAIMGGFSNVWVGLRNEIKLEISPHAGDAFQRMGIYVRAYIRADVAVVRPNQLTRITGITTSR